MLYRNISESSREMPRVRLRSVENLAGSNSALLRFYHWMNGGESWSHHHASVFVITFFSFAFIHASRKTLSTVKPSMIEIWTHNSTHSGPLFPNEQSASEFLALLDGAFLFAYAFGLFFGGILGDIYDPRVVLAIGMWLSALATFSFGYVTEYFQIYSKLLYAFLWTSSGLFQSVAWPSEVSIMGNWFGHHSRGAVMGLWSGCASVGNIIGSMIASKMVILGYEYAFAINSVILFVFAFIVFFNLISAPRLLGLAEAVEDVEDANRVIEVRPEVIDHRPEPINFFRAWLLPGVIPYSLAYACLKLVNYGFFFWLPYYLSSHFHWPESDADALSTWYDVGGIVAGVLAGAVSDHFSSRTPIIFPMLLLASASLYIYAHSPSSYLANTLMLIVTGFFIGGPANLMSGAVAADLGRAREIRGSAEALSTVTGIVDGTGSVGAAFGQLLIPSVQLWFGWGAVFYGFIVMTLCTAICLLPLLVKEICSRRNHPYSNLDGEGGDESANLLQDDRLDPESD